MAFLALSTKSMNMSSESLEKACQGRLFTSLTKSLVDSGHLVGLFPLSFSILYSYSPSFGRTSFFSF
jgi:hypothetical protein